MKSWQLAFNAGLDHQASGTQKPGSIRFRASGSGQLDAVPEAAGYQWRGTGTYAVSSATRVDSTSQCAVTCISNASHAGTAPSLEGLGSGALAAPWMLMIDGECRFQLYVGNLDAPREWRCFYPCGDPRRRHERATHHFGIELHEQPLPESGLRVSGNLPLAADASGTDVASAHGYADDPWDPDSTAQDTPRGTGRLSFTLSPEPEKLELVVEPTGYDTWEPKGHLDPQKPGNQLELIAKLKPRGGGTAQEKAKLIRFELAQVSRELGVALNHPPRAQARRDPDLRFEKSRNPRLTVAGDGLSAETPDARTGAYTEAKAQLSAFDWGAWGELRVTAVMPDGREIVGRLARDPRPQILLPKRREDSRIPDALRNAAALGDLPDDNDGENDPMGDEFSGDGLTLYEEYRGFYQNGDHMRGSPVRKDLFVRDEIGGHSKLGIALFARETRVRVHHELLASELGTDRVINANHSDAPHLVDQHGVKMDLVDPPDPQEGSAPSRFATSRAFGGPGTPESVELVAISSAAPQGGAAFPRLIAHELAHAVNVRHHGSGDVRQLVWRQEALPGGDTRLTENGTPIELRNEAGQPRRFPRSGVDVSIWVGAPRGEHCGVEACFMRYSVADAYRTASEPGVRYWVQGSERGGDHLCESPEGTGVNARDRTPRPRYGDAQDCFGACKHAIRVSDEGDAPPHGRCRGMGG